MSDTFPAPITNKEGDVLNESDIQVVHVTYALFALGLLTGVFAVVGLIIAYIKRDEAVGHYLVSHFNWLIRTFWWSLLWYGILCVLILLTLGLGAFVLWPFFTVVWLWDLYRIIKGWLRLTEKRAVA